MLNQLKSFGVVPHVASAKPLEGLSLEQLQRWPMADVSACGRRGYLPDRPDRLWLLKSGVARTITYQEDGTAIALGLWSAGDIVGQALSDVDPYLIEALTEVEAVSIALSDWQPPVDVITSYLKHTEALMVVRTHRRAETALLGLLQWLANRFGLQIDRGCLIDLKITHQDLADFSGLSRVTVTRLLRQFEEQGLIYRRSRQLILAETSDHWHYEI
ncbi:Crp/Fnr family transcriptional regulator [filamentous cyanobacterium CCP3]|nr:Crp/Fnr family transcriptional regulator [filamentous cyanobacterium CCP3]